MPRPTEEELARSYEKGRSEAIAESEKAADRPMLIRWLWDEIKGFFVAMFESVWAGFIRMLEPAVFESMRVIDLIFEPLVRSFTNFTFDFYQALGIMDKDDIRALKPMQQAHWLPQFGAGLMTWLIVVGGFITQKSMIMLGTLRQTLNKIHSPNPPSPGEILMAAFVAPEKTGEVRDALARAGLSQKDIDLIFLSAYRLYNEDVIRTLWLRGVLDDSSMYMRMRELGYTDTRIKEIIQGWDIIPGPGDLFHLVAKEAFEPDAIALMGLADEFPEEQVKWLEKQGISRDWSLKYWYAHWDQPSIQMGFEMLHRGVIGWKELNMLFKTVEIPPYWRDKLTKIAFNPYTRVDTRRMHEMGILSDEELVEAYMDQGYDEKHALNMAKFTIRYNLESQKELSKAEVLSGFRDNVLKKQDAIDLLIQLDYNKPQAQYLILYEEYKVQKGYQDDLIKNIEERYENNLIDDFEAQKRLNALNLPATQVSILMDRWQIKRFVDQKIPSKTDLDKFLRNKVIKTDIYRLEMHKLGYGAQYISWYEKLIELKKAG